MTIGLLHRRSIAAALAGTALFGLASVGTAQQASAATVNVYEYTDGGPQNISLFLWYNSNEKGAGAWFSGDLFSYSGYGRYVGSDFYNYVFQFQPGGGTGGGYPLKNNAASVTNANITDSYTVYYNSNYQGASQMFTPVDYGTSHGNLNVTLKNNNASQYERTFI